MFELISSTEVTTGFSPVSPSLFLLDSAATVTDALTYLANITLSLSPNSDCWRSVTVVPMPKSSSPTALAKRSHPIALRSQTDYLVCISVYVLP